MDERLKTAADRFAAAMREAIAESELSHNQIGRATEIPQPIISRFVTGERSISLENYATLAVYFRLGRQLERICGK